MIDLHIHSNASGDGEFSARDIIDMAIDKNLTHIAIADHESVANVRESLEYSKDKDIVVVPACEVFTSCDGRLLHMLAYNFDLDNKPLNEILDKITDSRYEGIEKQFQIIEKQGLKIDRDLVFEFAGCDIPLPSAYIYSFLSQEENKNHPLVNGLDNSMESIIKVSRSAFGFGGPLTVDTYMPDTATLIDAIIKSDGKAVLAHPGVDVRDDLYILEHLMEQGISGLEAYYTSHTKEQCEFYKNYARENRLIYTLGSDFHGHFKPKFKIGGLSAGSEEKNEIMLKGFLEAIGEIKGV